MLILPQLTTIIPIIISFFYHFHISHRTADEETVSRSITFSFIENLPDECLIEIFSYLSSNELKNVTITCRTLANVVNSSSRLMKNFFMVVTRKRKWDFGTISVLQRKHQALVFFDYSTLEESLDNALIDGLENIGANIKTLEFNDCSLNASDFVHILEITNNLKHLKVFNSKILGSVYKFLDLKHLISLKIIKSEVSYEIFNNVRNLHNIEIETHETNNIDLTHFQKILFSQLKLKHLTLINLRLSNLFDTKMDCSFQLESLKLIQCHFRHKENFEIFLENQMSMADIELSLSNMKLALDRVRYYDSIIACLMRKYSLTSLTLNIEEYKFASFSFMEGCRAIKLSLRSKDTNFSSSPFLKYFPLLESLEVDIKELNDENLEIINTSSRLITLKIINISSDCFGNVKNKNIQSLYIHETLIDQCDWKKFIENNPQIIKLVIRFSFLMDFDVNFLEYITQKLNLVHIELIDRYVGFDNGIYKMICENCNRLKYIKLWNINIEKNFDEIDKDFLRRKNIKFHLFNDESLNKPMIPF